MQMSLLGKLSPAEGSTHYRKRVGRGIGSGLGGYSGKGGKGQTQRSGGSIRRGFEGGQTPLHRRLPKFGFSNVAFETKFEVVNLADLAKLSGDVTPEALSVAGLVKKNALVKILANGELKQAINVKAHKFSEKAKAAIEKAGGKAEVLGW
jgi:large subunit ribosomal protein L15